ncbi:MAG: GtrA family protein [Clostridia bacterium]|nr:GtrA family protein [Clostridia bacterium]
MSRLATLFKKYKEVILYLIIGVLTTAVSFAVQWLFTDATPLNHAGLTTFIAWFVSVLFAFFANRIFVFESKGKKGFFKELLLFYTSRVATGLLEIGSMWLFVDILLFNHWVIKIIANIVIIVLNYILSKFIVFRKKRGFASIMKKWNIEYYAMVPLSRLKVVKEYLLTKNDFDENANVIMMLLPYRSERTPKNLTVYASVKDYHELVSLLGKELESFVKKSFSDAKFKVFADHSPIDEVHGACICGLGFIGDNGLLINEKYSSFVFLAECITSLSPKELGLTFAEENDVVGCLHCGKCKQACPSQCIGSSSDKKKECLSAITQKKGELSQEEIDMMMKNGSIWGCDACQNACPYTKNAKYTPIKFFCEDVIEVLDTRTINSLSDEEFNKRPFAWRGRGVVLRNAEIYEKYRGEENG